MLHDTWGSWVNKWSTKFCFQENIKCQVSFQGLIKINQNWIIFASMYSPQAGLKRKPHKENSNKARSLSEMWDFNPRKSGSDFSPCIYFILVSWKTLQENQKSKISKEKVLAPIFSVWGIWPWPTRIRICTTNIEWTVSTCRRPRHAFSGAE